MHVIVVGHSPACVRVRIVEQLVTLNHVRVGGIILHCFL